MGKRSVKMEIEGELDDYPLVNDLASERMLKSELARVELMVNVMVNSMILENAEETILE